jgi:glutamine synthetase
MTEIAYGSYLASSGVRPEPDEALSWALETKAKMVDLKFCDLLGTWQHVTMPLRALEAASFQEGLGFDGSSIRGWQGIAESDMLLMPDPGTAIVDPFAAEPTVSFVCEIADPVTLEPYARDPRRIARRAEEHLAETGIADAAYFGPECEFFVFDSVSYAMDVNHARYEVDSEEAHWNTHMPGLGYKVREKGGYFPVAPHDTLGDLRTEMVLRLEQLGVLCEFHHHEVATAGQCEIDMRFQTLTRMADQVQLYKYLVRNVARAAGKTATFMPKPIFGDNGSGMHTHQSLWKEGETLMAGEGYAGLSDLAEAYVAGLLAHAPALLAFCAPTTNSYRRLVPGYEAPVNLVHSARNRSAAIRIPMYSDAPKAKRIEFRCPDATANPYLAFAAMLMAGLDGIERGLEPGEPADYDLFEEDRGVTQVPGSLEGTLDALERDHEFLLRGGVFSEELIEAWVAYKRENEVDVVRLRPHPAEFALYFDA